MVKGDVTLDVATEILAPPCVDTGLTKALLALTGGAVPMSVESGYAGQDSTPWRRDFWKERQEHQLALRRQGLQVSGGTMRSFKATSFKPEVEEELERTSPQGLLWLQTSFGCIFQGLLIFSFVAFEATSTLLTSFVLKPDPPPKFKPLPGSMAVVISGCSVILGLLIGIFNEIVYERTHILRAIPKAMAGIFHWRSIISYSLVAAIYSVAAIFGMMAYAKVDAGLKKILDQLRLPVTAAMSTVIVGKRYSMHQWLAMIIMTLAICSFYMSDVEYDAVTELRTTCHFPPMCFEGSSPDICGYSVDGPTLVGTKAGSRTGRYDITTFRAKSSTTNWEGLFLNLAGTVLNCLGSLFSERILKSNSLTPLSTQIAQCESTGLPTSLAMSFLVPLLLDSDGGKGIWWTKTDIEGSGEGFFQGFDQLTCIVIALKVIKTWLVVTIVKHFSTVVKNIAACFVLLLAVLCTGTFLKPCQAETLPMTMFATAFVICVATVLFVVMPKDSDCQQQALPTAPTQSQDDEHKRDGGAEGNR
jgi:hypothetical protein